LGAQAHAGAIRSCAISAGNCSRAAALNRETIKRIRWVMAVSRRKEKRDAAPVPVVGLSQRPVWQGHLRLSLVSCAVGLYKATTTANDISFNLINPKTGNRIRMITTDPDTGPVDRSTLVKGYAVEKNNYVLFSDEELQSVKLDTTRTLDIERFVDAGEIDRLYWDTPYVLMPTDRNSVEAYGVIQAAMVKANRIALGRVVMHTRERLMAIEPREHGLIATTLRMADEVLNISEALGSIPEFKQDKQMVDIALRIIEQQEGAFAPAEFTDRYEEALRVLVEEKKKGHRIEHISEPRDAGNVVDLMDALRKSLQGQRAPQAKSATVTRLPKRKAPR
jgi:DNA end-binding protein Ku